MVRVNPELKVEASPTTLLQKVTVGSNSGRLKGGVPDLARLFDHKSEMDREIIL
jgi:hypothetical protein